MSGFVVDENLSPTLAATLRDQGHDAVHVNDPEVKLGGAPDLQIMEWAQEKGRTIITQDSDFVDALRVSGASGPSVIHISQRGGLALPGTELQADQLRG